MGRTLKLGGGGGVSCKVSVCVMLIKGFKGNTTIYFYFDISNKRNILKSKTLKNDLNHNALHSILLYIFRYRLSVREFGAVKKNLFKYIYKNFWTLVAQNVRKDNLACPLSKWPKGVNILLFVAMYRATFFFM